MRYITEQMDKEIERKLIEQAKKNPEAFGELFDAHYRQIFGYVLRRVGDVETARDITADVFVQAFSNIGRFHWRGIRFASWLYRIASNTIASHFRGRRPTASLDALTEVGFEPKDDADMQAELLAAEAEVERHQQFLIIQQLLTKLSGKYQEVIALRFFEEKSIAEIAEILGRPEGTITSQIARGLAQLQQRYAQQNATPKDEGRYTL